MRIAAPCKADWEEMIGTQRVRFCGQCNLNVYNLSSMSTAQAESLIAQTEGRLCVRFYRRSDGSILTENCPVGLRAIRRRLSYLAKAASATVLSFFAGVGVYRGVSAPPPPLPLMGMVAIPGPGLLAESHQPGMSLSVTAEVGRVLISQPLQNLAERKASRRKNKLRTGSTR